MSKTATLLAVTLVGCVPPSGSTVENGSRRIDSAQARAQAELHRLDAAWRSEGSRSALACRRQVIFPHCDGAPQGNPCGMVFDTFASGQFEKEFIQELCPQLSTGACWTLFVREFLGDLKKKYGFEAAPICTDEVCDSLEAVELRMLRRYNDHAARLELIRSPGQLVNDYALSDSIAQAS